jgi:hypothetical protein
MVTISPMLRRCAMPRLLFGLAADSVAATFLDTGRLPTREQICPGPATPQPPTVNA